MNYWLAKTEPGTYAWEDLVRDKQGLWDGVRNFEARNNIAKMKNGDGVLIYHTGSIKSVVGIALVINDPFPESGATDWMAVNLKPLRALKNPVTLDHIRKDASLKNMVLVKNSRLSVQPVTKIEFDQLLKLSEKNL
jgi:predicted RNA-binding protein with PUA-like domain